MPTVIQLLNGATYTKKQIKSMFGVQIDSVRQNVQPSDKARLEKWLSEGNEH